MKKIEHLGIAVNNLKEANELYTQLLGIAPYKEESVESEGVTTSFFMLGQTKIELLEGTNEDSPIRKFIAKRGPGIHHIAFAVEDISVEINRLQKEGFILLNETPKPGADGKVVAFLHPKSSGGVLVELCMDAEDYLKKLEEKSDD
ncbi:MAG: methylmalonyl-CoA epimerase [Flavobacteriaceae bacterium]|nr:methylmalonyl-CoA epimerase [Flavobacteriaceae bacterium]